MRWLILGTLLGLAVGSNSVAQEPKQPAELITLGTGGGPVSRVKRSGPANAVVVGDDLYLFDIGPGTVRQLAAAGLSNHRLRAIFLSHHHIDHIGDLSSLIGTRWVLRAGARLPIYGPPGTAALVADTLKSLAILESVPITAGRPIAQAKLTASAIGHDVPPAPDPRLIYEDEQLRVDVIDVAHFHIDQSSHEASPRALALRITTGGRVITYTGDTGPSERITRLAKGSDLLLSEVIDLERTQQMLARTVNDPKTVQAVMAHMKQDHLTSEEVGRIAASAGVNTVVLTHLVPGLDNDVELSRYSRGVSTLFRGKVLIAEDLQRY